MIGLEHWVDKTVSCDRQL